MLNHHFKNLKTAYVFPIIEKKFKKKLTQLQREHPNQEIYNLGVGDICLPLAPKIKEVICAAVEEMTVIPRGYGPCGGYDFLKETICAHEYAQYGLSYDEIFISDGANADAACLPELLGENSSIGITNPTYPVYRDANLLTGKKIITLDLKEEEGFIPRPPKERVDLVYLCTPCNPTGVALNKNDLEEWIAWAKKHRSILLIDNVYQAFASSDEIPSSIYALEGAKEVAIEIRSFSKWAGFTGLRCGYTVIPKTLHIPEFNGLWQKRIDIKTNGISYPIQKGAQACFTKEVKEELKEQIEIYKSSSKILRHALAEQGQIFYGGIHSPYIWWKVPSKMTSWDFFDQLLEHSRIVTIPGASFGSAGEGYVRLSCFLSNSLAREAADALHHHFATI